MPDYPPGGHGYLPSAEFRKVYARLTGPCDVTVNGHVIGTYYPAELGPILPPAAPIQNAPKTRPETPRERQKRIDGVLRKANG
jgi:hypothetical protein